MSSLPCELLWNHQIYEGLRDASGLTLTAASNILRRNGTPRRQGSAHPYILWCSRLPPCVVFKNMSCQVHMRDAGELSVWVLVGNVGNIRAESLAAVLHSLWRLP